jgi:nitrate/nitrite transport system substrate-binding protein
MTRVGEKRALTIGLTPLTDSAPIVVARERGFFARYGLDVSLSVEPSWANVRDKLVAGTVDAAHLLAPVALALSVGAGPLHCPMLTGLSLGLNGNAITVSRALRRRLSTVATESDLATAAGAGRALAALLAQDRVVGARRLRFATVFPFSMHDYALRYWLAACGVDPERDVERTVVPPPRMVERLAAGEIDGFCVGEPWSTLAVQLGIGSLLLPTHAIWSDAPEKVLGVTLAWAERNPETHRLLLAALLEAGEWCDVPANRGEVAQLLARTGIVAAPERALLPSLRGECLRDDGVGPPRAERLSDFHLFYRHAAGFPWRSHASWILVQMLRWGQLEKPLDVRAAAAATYRTDLHRKAAALAGVSVPELDEKTEGGHDSAWSAPGSLGGIPMGVERFFDGSVFDPGDVVGALGGYEIAHPRVRLEELAAAQR